MRSNIEIVLIYSTGLMQGLVLVTVPAASSVFTDPHFFDFSASQYGALFIPQVIMSIMAALVAPKVSSKIGSKLVYQAGVAFNCVAAALVALSQCFVGHPAAYICVMLSTSAVGAAFGTTLPMINVYAQRFFPQECCRGFNRLAFTVRDRNSFGSAFGRHFCQTDWLVGLTGAGLGGDDSHIRCQFLFTIKRRRRAGGIGLLKFCPFFGPGVLAFYCGYFSLWLL